ncbi:TORTIFOLIA1-like protein 5 [Elaeis guineensis]|uniref:TORTIFOLIA1-like protein 5 n=1 Tax=Elaeis guineensis var. tenera TaxID=51953 RepID=UPI003C6D25C9
MASKPHTTGSGDGMRQRVNRCLTKLSDRDTEAMAASELESIAKSLTPDSFSPFLSAIADTRPTDKTPLRRHSLRLISLLSNSHPASSLAPHLPRMLAAALRRIRDPDSSVRAACVDAVRSMAATHPAAVAPVLLRPLADALLHEQDHCAQIASALCLAAAVDAAAPAAPDLVHHLQRLLPRLVKLLRSNAFKAKPALISLLGSVAGSGGACTPALLGLLVPCLAEFLASEDWAARKAAAEALSRLAVSEKDRLAGFKASCLSSFENRRFDKVKIVRDSMNRMLELWKDIPAALDGDSNALPASPSQSNPSLRESASDGRYPTASVSSSSVQSAAFVARKSRFSSSRSPPPAASPIPTTRKRTPPIRNEKLSPPLFRKTNTKQNSDWRVEIAIPNTPSVKVVSEDAIMKGQEQGGMEGNVRSRLEARRMLFEKNSEDKGNKLAGLKSASRVVPFQDAGSIKSTAGADHATDDLNPAHKDSDLSLIRMQLVQIENQQASLLDLLQRFIGSSQNGIQSLETRVHGLEMALDEISRDLALTSGRISNNDPGVNTCCRLPGAEFLSSKFWRRAEGRYSSRLSISEMQNLSEKEGKGPYKWDKQRFGLQGGFVVNPLAEINPQSGGNTEVASQKTRKSMIHDAGMIHNQEGKKQDEVSQNIRSA